MDPGLPNSIHYCLVWDMNLMYTVIWQDAIATAYGCHKSWLYHSILFYINSLAETHSNTHMLTNNKEGHLVTSISPWGWLFVCGPGSSGPLNIDFLPQFARAECSQRLLEQKSGSLGVLDSESIGATVSVTSYESGFFVVCCLATTTT